MNLDKFINILKRHIFDESLMLTAYIKGQNSYDLVNHHKIIKILLMNKKIYTYQFTKLLLIINYSSQMHIFIFA